MNQNQWKLPQIDYTKFGNLEQAGVPPLLAAVLRARGIENRDRANEYLSHNTDLLANPFLLDDMQKAVDRITVAIQNGEKVAIYGDYDVDGITSSCLLKEYLSSCGIECSIYIPDRLNEGYGINAEAVETLSKQGVSLIITVDCGITAIDECEIAKSLGMDMIITDHHECAEEIPQAVAVIDPKRNDSRYPTDFLAGVGVAFKLVCAIEGGFELPLREYSDLVAIGTIADVMPLVGENRCLVAYGLKKLKENPRLGFKALIDEAGASQRPMDAVTVSFTLAPRINAAGRLSQTQVAVDSITSKTLKEATVYAKELCELNSRRQQLETEVWKDATKTLEENPPQGPIVLGSTDWHPGVVGIAASRLTEEYKIPAIMICIDGENGKGSCRSFGGFNLYNALTECSDCLLSFGGHAFAAGLCIHPDKIDDFRDEMWEYYKQHPPEGEGAIEPEILINNPSLVDMNGVESLSVLEPCGNENPRPLMCMENVYINTITPIGNGRHLRLRVSKNDIFFDCVYFSHTIEELEIKAGTYADLCFVPHINEFRSRKSVQLLIWADRPSQELVEAVDVLEDNISDWDTLKPMRPDRDDLAIVWKSMIRMEGKFSQSLDDIKRKRSFSGMESKKLCICMKILFELGLLKYSVTDGTINAYIIKNTSKKELSNSLLYALLWA